MISGRKPSVIVTGVSSFVGMHLAMTFAAKGWRTVGVITKPKPAYQGVRALRLAALSDTVEFAQCDIADEAQVVELIGHISPRLWLHHAAAAENYHSADYDLAASLPVNVLSLEAIYRNLADRDCGVIVTGTSMEYTTGDAPHKESDPCWPDMPYGVSKLMESVEANRLALHYKVPTRVARLFIPIGAYDTPGRLIDHVMRRLIANERVQLTSCEQIKDFVAVEDVCRGYVALYDDLDRAMFDVFNICSGKPMQLKALLTKLCAIISADVGLLNFGALPNRPHEPRVLCGDNSKAREILKWAPVDIDRTLSDMAQAARRQ